LTGSPDQFFFFLKSKQRRFSKKQKQKSTGRNRVFDRVTPDFSFPYFFFNPTWFESRVDSPGRVSKL
jgi:hypothetical protein